MANRELLAERVSSAAVSSGGTGSPTLYGPVYITLTWVHNEILPAELLKGFRVVLFLGTNPNDTSQYLVRPREFPASDRSCVMMVRVDTSLQINAAIQSLYTDGNESSWRQLSGTVTVDPDTKLLADKAGLDATSATANSALRMAYAAADDGILSMGEKPNIIILFNSAQADYTSLSTQAQATGVDYSVLSEAWSTLNAVVTSLTPAYTDTTADTPIPNPTEWNATWTAWNSAKTSTLIKLLTAPPNSINAVMASNVANLTTNATQPTIDGVLQAAGNKLLLIGQTTKSQNGYYEVGYTPSQGAAKNIWPTAYTESSTGCVANPVNAYDNSGSPDYTPNNSTSANLDSSFSIRNIKYHTFPGSTNINGTLHIVVTPECNYDTRGGSSSVIVDISTDGGTTWTTVASYDPETTTQQDIQYSLVGVAPQNVKVMVRAIGYRYVEWDPDLGQKIYITTTATVAIHSVYIYTAAVGSPNWFYTKRNEVKDKSIWRVLSGTTYGGKSYTANVATDNGITLSQTVAAYEAPLGLPSQNAQVLCSDTNGVRYWATVSGGGGGGGAWGSITGTLANQTDLQNALNGKAASSHTHGNGDLTGLSSASVAYAASAGNADTLDGNHASAFATASHSHAYSSLTGVPSTFAPTAHTHAAADLPAYPTLASLGAQAAATAITTSNIASQSVANAAKLAGMAPQDAAGPNTIVTRDANGYTQLYYIHSNTGNAENPTISQVIVTNGSDGFYRKATLAHLVSSMDLSAKSVSYAASAGAVAWGNITGKPIINAALVGAISNASGLLSSSTRGTGADLRFRDISNGLTYALYVEAGVLKLIQV